MPSTSPCQRNCWRSWAARREVSKRKKVGRTAVSLYVRWGQKNGGHVCSFLRFGGSAYSPACPPFFFYRRGGRVRGNTVFSPERGGVRQGKIESWGKAVAVELESTSYLH